jgi:hypothetical protein
MQREDVRPEGMESNPQESVVTTTWVRAAISFNVAGCEASAVMSCHDRGVSGNPSRARSGLSGERPAGAMRASTPALARYSAVSLRRSWLRRTR